VTILGEFAQIFADPIALEFAYQCIYVLCIYNIYIYTLFPCIRLHSVSTEVQEPSDKYSQDVNSALEQLRQAGARQVVDIVDIVDIDIVDALG